MILTLLTCLITLNAPTLIAETTATKDAEISSDAVTAKALVQAEVIIQKERPYWNMLRKAERAIATDEFDPCYDIDTVFFTKLITDKEPYAKIHAMETGLLGLKKLIEDTIKKHPNIATLEERRTWEKECSSLATTLKNSGIKIYAARTIAQLLVIAATVEKNAFQNIKLSAADNNAKNLRILKKLLPHIPNGILEIERCKQYYPELLNIGAMQTQGYPIYWGPPYLYLRGSF